jgi:competence protein ComEC
MTARASSIALRARSWRAGSTDLRARLAAHPRHLVLAALAAGLAAGPRAALALVPAIALGAWVSARAGVALAIALAASAGAVAGQERVAALDRSGLGPLFGHVVTERVTLLEPARRGRFRRASATVRLRGEPVIVRGPGRGPWLHVGAGGELIARGTLRAPDEFSRRLGAHAVLRAESVAPTGAGRAGVMGAVDGVRRRAEDALSDGLPPPEAGLMRGMVLGQDQALPGAVREHFRASGLSHLVAASGQNVMLLAALAIACAAALGTGLRARLAVVLGLIAIYVPLAGAGPSIQRAGVMGAAGVVAAMAGRPASRWYAVLLAAGVTLALDPRAPADPGWQMSFAAVVAILALCARWAEALARRRVPRALAEVVAMTGAATLATAPIVAWHFGSVSLVSLPANVLAAPVVAPIMWLGMISGAVGQLAPEAAGLPVAVAAYPLAYLIWLAEQAAHVPGATVAASPLVVLAAVFVLPAALRHRRVALRIAPAIGVIAVAAIVALKPAGTAPPSGLRVTFLDVGQGDATLVQDPHAAILVDTGPPDGGVVARLHRAAVRQLDVLVVTHAQADHDGGAAAVLRELPVGLAIDGRDGVRTPGGDRFAREARRRGVRLVVPDTGHVLRTGGLELRILHPRREPAAAHAGGDPNERAVVSLVRHGSVEVLLTADAESEVLSTLELPPVDVMKVSHHGSADPGLPGLLARVRPAVAVISVGERNTFGHPAPQAVRALDSVVPRVYRTDRDGTVRIDADGPALMVRADA